MKIIHINWSQMFPLAPWYFSKTCRLIPLILTLACLDLAKSNLIANLNFACGETSCATSVVWRHNALLAWWHVQVTLNSSTAPTITYTTDRISGSNIQCEGKIRVYLVREGWHCRKIIAKWCKGNKIWFFIHKAWSEYHLHMSSSENKNKMPLVVLIVLKISI